MNRNLMIGVIGVLMCVTVGAQEGTPGQNKMFTTGAYTLPDGKPAVVLAIELLEAKGWVVTAVTARVLPRGFVLENGQQLTVDTTAYDIFAKYKPAAVQPPPKPVVEVSCPGPDPFSSLPGYVGKCVNGGWVIACDRDGCRL